MAARPTLHVLGRLERTEWDTGTRHHKLKNELRLLCESWSDASRRIKRRYSYKDANDTPP